MIAFCNSASCRIIVRRVKRFYSLANGLQEEQMINQPRGVPKLSRKKCFLTTEESLEASKIDAEEEESEGSDVADEGTTAAAEEQELMDDEGQEDKEVCG